MIKIDIGCGMSKHLGTLGVDIAPLAGVDVVADINTGLPFRDSVIDEVHMSHTLEHVDDFLATMEEIWRVCKDGALFYIRLPHGSSSFTTWVDPTHKRGFNIQTFTYFDPEVNHLSYYSKARFKLVYSKLALSTLPAELNGTRLPRRVLSMVLESVANKSPHWRARTERWFAQLIGFEEARVVLRAMKPGAPARREGPGLASASRRNGA
ncbi:MAG TPA: class I SAM-dependent methyltransferase [Dehalococcoidia bacterium]|nr:class I SAM-dependent methyltransferase [Dehalococcoidia bacterium]